MSLLDETGRMPRSHGAMCWRLKPPSFAEAQTCLVNPDELQIEGRARELAMFNLAIDSKLRGCDVVAIRSRMSPRAATRQIAQPFD